jgi:hypothetical protein
MAALRPARARQGSRGFLPRAQSAPPGTARPAAPPGRWLEPRVTAPSGPARYEIRVAGVLDGRWAAWFDGLQISGQGEETANQRPGRRDGKSAARAKRRQISSQGEETVICGLLADQPALHGLLTKVRDLGLCLISVRRLDIANLSSK